MVVSRREDWSGKRTVKNSGEVGKEQSCDQIKRVEEQEASKG